MPPTMFGAMPSSIWELINEGGSDPPVTAPLTHAATIPPPMSPIGDVSAMLPQPMAPNPFGPPHRGFDWKQLLPSITPVVGALLAKGGPAKQAFVEGYYRGEALKRQMDLQRAERDDRAAEGQQRRRESVLARQERFLSELMNQAADTTSRAEFDDLVSGAEAFEELLELPKGTVRQRLRYSPAREERAIATEASARVASLKKDYGERFYAEAFQRVSVPFRGDLKSVAELRRLAGDALQSNARGDLAPVTSAPSRRPTFAEFWPAAKDSPFGAEAVPMKGDAIDWSEAMQVARANGWAATADERAAKQRAWVKKLREQLIDAARSPGTVNLTVLARQMRAAGLDWNAERNQAARTVEREERERARSVRMLESGPRDPLTGVTEDPAAARDRRMQAATDRLDAVVKRLEIPAAKTPPPSAQAPSTATTTDYLALRDRARPVLRQHLGRMPTEDEIRKFLSSPKNREALKAQR